MKTLLTAKEDAGECGWRRHHQLCSVFKSSIAALAMAMVVVLV
jgi:hypothetical protein